MNACHALVTCHAQPVGTPNYRGFDGAELPSCFVYIVYVFATIVVHFRLLFNPSIFNISPPLFLPLLRNLSSIASFFYIFKESSNTNNIFVWSLCHLFDTPTPFSKLERKKSTRFFFRPIRENQIQITSWKSSSRES